MTPRPSSLAMLLVVVGACGSKGLRVPDAADGPVATADAGDDAAIEPDCQGQSCSDAGADQREAGDTMTAGDSVDSAIVDAGVCRGDLSELTTLGYAGPCPSLVDAGLPTLSCVGRTPGLSIFWAVCEQRETLVLDFGTHSQTCVYELGTLVGVELGNDTLGFCNGTSFAIAIGSADGCPWSMANRILNCDPFVDSDWQPWAPDAR